MSYSEKKYLNKSDIKERIEANNKFIKIKALNKVTAVCCVNAILGLITDALSDGHRVEIRSFGSFSVRCWGSRFARNAKTGDCWMTEATKAIYFRPATLLKRAVNSE